MLVTTQPMQRHSFSGVRQILFDIYQTAAGTIGVLCLKTLREVMLEVYIYVSNIMYVPN